MHEGEVAIDEAVVRGLVRSQFPEFGNLSVRRVQSTGTVNAIFRLGDELLVRLPRLSHWEASLQREWEWIPRLAGHVSLSIPEPVVLGKAAAEYPLCWAVYRWITGDVYSEDPVEDEGRAAEDLGTFVLELRSVSEVDGAPAGGRRPLRELDEMTRRAVMSAGDMVDAPAVLAMWEAALEAPLWNGAPVWLHGDLLPPNLLVRGDRLTAVLDFGGVGIGDPAADVVPAWSVFGPVGRERFRHAIGVEDGVWLRARGYALHQAVMIVPYYAETNPRFVEMAMRTIDQILADV
jgi:aminoglycoside phosphotransferase (APT) family kinase protein